MPLPGSCLPLITSKTRGWAWAQLTCGADNDLNGVLRGLKLLLIWAVVSFPFSLFYFTLISPPLCTDFSTHLCPVSALILLLLFLLLNKCNSQCNPVMFAPWFTESHSLSESTCKSLPKSSFIPVWHPSNFTLAQQYSLASAASHHPLLLLPWTKHPSSPEHAAVAGQAEKLHPRTHTSIRVFSFVLCFPNAATHFIQSATAPPTGLPTTHTHTHTHTHTQDSPRLSICCALFCLNESEVILHSSLHRIADHINPGTSFFSHVPGLHDKKCNPSHLFHLRHQM